MHRDRFTRLVEQGGPLYEVLLNEYKCTDVMVHFHDGKMANVVGADVILDQVYRIAGEVCRQRWCLR